MHTVFVCTYIYFGASCAALFDISQPHYFRYVVAVIVLLNERVAQVLHEYRPRFCVITMFGIVGRK